MSHRVFIADDEPLARERVIRLLADSGYEVCGQAANGEQALQGIGQLKPDIALLDIRMPGKDGLATALELSRLPFPPAVIFLTAYDDYLLEAFSVSAQGYLLKPIRREALLEAMQKAAKVTLAQLTRIREEMAHAHATEFLVAKTSKGEQRIPLSEVLYLQAEQKYVVIHAISGETLTDASLKDIEHLHPSLLRIHRHTLINSTQLEALQRSADGSCSVQLRHCSVLLPVSRRLLPEIRQFLRHQH
jgi:two-component system response regulator AlgR